ncbi:MAG: Xaa-Pro peptidase family protein [Candidatus Bipolaricaulota bacterium]
MNDAHGLEHEKLSQIPSILRDSNIDTWLVWVRETVQIRDPVLPILLGADLVWPSALLFTAAGERTAIVGTYDAEVVPSGLYERVIPYTEGIAAPLLAELDRIAPRTIAINESRSDVAADGLTAGMKALLEEMLAPTSHAGKLVSAERVIGRLRGRKSPLEQERIRNAVRITEEIFDDLDGVLAVGQTEREIQQYVHRRVAERDVGFAWQAASNPAVDAGPNKAFGHGGPSENRTKRGHLLHFDFGVQADGYSSDLQRMYFFGQPSEVPAEIERAFSTVRDAIRLAADALRPGIRGVDVDAVARRHVTERGYPPFAHALGHQVGRWAHDGGTLLGPAWERYGDSPYGVVEAGNVFTLELHVPTKSYGQVSLEEDVLVTETGCEFLSHPQDTLRCVAG